MKLEFEGEKIKIRKLKLSDAEDIYRNIKDTEATRWLEPNIQHYSKNDAVKFVRTTHRDIRNKKCYAFGIALKLDNKIIGCIGLSSISWKNKNSEVGYWLGKKYWGEGFGREAIKLVVKFGFEQLKLHRIYGIISEENIASQKVLEKCEFELEGKLKDEFYYGKQWHNGLIYGLLNKK